ncbi:MAG: hypothetical protein A2096_01590 [Spirochaetes bacterium GWF1_41_5]|nr:MAG: hypothetical protein A2096_01590 [Spirochaetes bacterium GWF1_41_5]
MINFLKKKYIPLFILTGALLRSSIYCASLEKELVIKQNNYSINIGTRGQFAFYIKKIRMLSSGAMMFGFAPAQFQDSAMKEIRCSEDEKTGEKIITIKGLFDGLAFTETINYQADKFSIAYDIEVMEDTPAVQKGNLRFNILKLPMDILETIAGAKYRLETAEGQKSDGSLSSMLPNNTKLQYLEFSGANGEYAFFDFSKTKAVLYERRSEAKPEGLWIFSYPLPVEGSSGVIKKGYRGRMEFTVFLTPRKSAAGTAPAGKINLLKNPSLEVCANPGYPDYWGVGQSLRIKNFNPFCRLQNQDSWHGKNCIFIKNDNPQTNEKFYYSSIFLPVIPGKTYTFSTYIKSDREGAAAYLAARGVTIIKKNASAYFSKPVKTTTAWERYSMTFNTEGISRIEVKVQFMEGNYFLDALQLEEGDTATSFKAEGPAEQKTDTVQGVSETTTAMVPEIKCPVIAAPLLDGIPDDACWKQAAHIPVFYLHTAAGEKEPQDKTEAWIARGEDSLYLAFRCAGTNFKSEIRAHDSEIYRDDCIEIFADPDSDAKDYYHLAYNIHGSTYDREVTATPGSSWEPEWEVKTGRQKDGWTSEVKIPFSCFTIKQNAARTMRINLCRENQNLKQYSSWSPVFGSFHSPGRFGKITFPEMDFSAYSISIENLIFKKEFIKGREYSLQLEICNSSQKPRRLGIDIKTISASGNINDTEHKTEDTFPIGNKQLVIKGFSIAEDIKSCTARIRVKDEEKNLVLASFLSRPVSVPTGTAILVEQNIYQQENNAKIFVHYEFSPELMRQENPELKLFSEKGQELRSIPAVPSHPFRNVFIMKIDDLPAGKYKVVSCLKDGTELGTDFLKKISADISVSVLNRNNGAVMVNGKPEFIRGILLQESASDDLLPYYRQWIKEIKEKNFNVIELGMKAPYQMSEITEKGIKEILDYAQETGLKVILWFSDRKKEYNSYLEDKMGKFRNHPALLGWQIVDEPAGGGNVSEAEVRVRYEFAKKLDPQHISFMNDVPVGFQKRYGAYPETGILPTDALCITYYPIADHHEDAADVGNFDNCPAIFNDMKQEAKKGGQAVWFWTQSFGYRWNWKRTPTPEEAVYLAYVPLVHGATGILHFMYRPEVEALWNKISELNLELSKLSPVIFAEPVGDAVIIAETVHGLLRKHNGSFYFIAVNTAASPRTVSFNLGALIGFDNAQAQVIFENRKLVCTKGVICDTFSGYERHVYGVKK